MWCLPCLAIVASSFLVVTGPAAGAELKPLQEVMASENSLAISFYFAKRCAAAYRAAATMMDVDGGEEGKALAAQLWSSSATFVKISVALADQAEMAADAGTIASDVAAMAQLYDGEMRRNYYATGNRFEGVPREDMELCAQILQN